jgi:histone deacetylase 1/2
MIANAPSVSTSSPWYPDSGTSFHVTGDSRNIQDPSPFAGAEHIYMGNGQSLPTISSGSSTFYSPHHTQTHLTLNNLLHVPSITKNLISVSQFAKDNAVFFEFHPNFCLVMLFFFKEMLDLMDFIASLIFPLNLPSHQLYTLVLSLLCNSSLSFNSLYLWHLRLGHPDDQTLKSTLKQCNISFSNNKNDVSTLCTACCMGKAQRLHSSVSQTIYTHPLKLVFSDLWGPSPSVSPLGYHYYITFILDKHGST